LKPRRVRGFFLGAPGMGAILGSLCKPSRHANIEVAEHESSDLFVAEKNLLVSR
jgi:hypothetical protein